MGLNCSSSGVGPNKLPQLALGNLLTSGEPEPQLPKWNPEWGRNNPQLEAYHVEQEDFNKKLLDYIRRLVGKSSSAGSSSGGGTGGDPGTIEVVTGLRYDTTLHGIITTLSRVEAKVISSRTVLSVNAKLLDEVVSDVSFDGASTTLFQDKIGPIYVFEVGTETENISIACVTPCTTPPCPSDPIALSWSGWSGVQTSDVLELDTVTFSSFLFVGESDDLGVLVKSTESVVLDITGSTATITLPENYVLFQDNFGHIGAGGNDILITDGTDSDLIPATEDDSSGNPHRHVSGLVFTSQAWSTAVTTAQLTALGMVDPDGIARVKICGVGDQGFVNVASFTCT